MAQNKSCATKHQDHLPEAGSSPDCYNSGEGQQIHIHINCPTLRFKTKVYAICKTVGFWILDRVKILHSRQV